MLCVLGLQWVSGATIRTRFQRYVFWAIVDLLGPWWAIGATILVTCRYSHFLAFWIPCEPWEQLFHAHKNLAIQGVKCPKRALGDTIYQSYLHLAILDVLCPQWALGARDILGILGLQWAVGTTVWTTCKSIHFQVFLFPWEQLYIIVIYIYKF